jgi:phosphomevalonate kinase
MSLSPCACSAPGKVLLAGGYLVLDRAHTGLVFGLDARIHVHVQELATSYTGVCLQKIIVRSPQFPGAEWRYGFNVSQDGGGVRVVQLTR